MNLRAVTLGCALAALAHGASAATYVYSFSGDCVGTCSTGGQISGQLVLSDTNYVAGAGVEEADFVSVEFRYSSGREKT